MAFDNIPVEERREKVAKAIEESTDFDMVGWKTCIAGHAMRAFGQHSQDYLNFNDARHILGIDQRTAEALFCPRVAGSIIMVQRLSKAEAARRVRELNNA